MANSHQNGAATREEEDETVDVESYGDEMSNTAVNLAANAPITSNIKIDSAQSSPHDRGGGGTGNEEHLITSVSNPWDRKHRLGIGMHGNAAPIMSNVARATPTSSDQISDYEEYSKERIGHHGPNGLGGGNVGASANSGDNDEEVVVDNTDDEICSKKSRQCDKKDDKNRFV